MSIMNMLTSRLVLAGVTLSFAAAVVACSGDDGAVIAAPLASSQGGDNPADDPSSDIDAGEPKANNPGTDAGLRGADGGPDAAPPRSMPLQCPQSALDPQICLETAEGRAGDVVDLEVHLVGSDTCRIANEAYGLLRIDPTYFELVNAGSHVDCTTRSQIPDPNTPGKDLITWQKFGAGAIPGCAAPVGIGKVDSIKVRIKPGTPPGDYSFGWDHSEFWGPTQACQVMGHHVGSEIRVLP